MPRRPDLPEWERARQRFRPEAITLLFVGESSPAGGTFFYYENSKLHDATKEAFRLAVPNVVRGDNFLEAFKDLGCYLDDLCLEPVNHLKLDNPLAKKKRLALRQQGEEPLAERIRDQSPQAVVVVMKGIEANVRAALSLAGLERLPVDSLPFPGRPEHRTRYIQELSAIINDYRGRGVLRASAKRQMVLGKAPSTLRTVES
jgi:hypothetical protein